MTKYVVKIEGQEVPVPDSIGALEDADLKRALTPMFPGAANSKIERAEKDGVTTITVVKLAGSKGSGHKNKKGGGFAALLSCKNRRNPVVELYQNLHTASAGDLKPEEMIVISTKVEKTIEAGERQAQEMSAALNRLAITSPQEGRDFVPLGF